MGLYINGIQYNILSPDGLLNIDINPYKPILNNPPTVSADESLLKDINGTYITIKKEDE
jgi:hypothetical protein